MNPVIDARVYEAFADIYDRVMRDVDYDSWSRHILHLAKRFKFEGKKILELACGTGSMALRFAALGYRVVGVDRSESMIRHARAKLASAPFPVHLFCGSMQSLSSLELDRDFDLGTCLYDSLNYILEETELARCFSEVRAHLRSGGGFIFDVTTEYNLLHNFAGYTFAENFEDSSYIWENDYNLENKICVSKVTIFHHEQDRYSKYVEMHEQRVYSTALLTKLLQQQGFEVLGAFHNLTEKPVQTECERIHFVCRKTG